MKLRRLLEKLYKTHELTLDEWGELVENRREIDKDELFKISDRVRREHFGNKVYIRGLIEFSNFCKNDCYYCGIRKSNTKADRYRLSPEQILKCCRSGYSLGFRTFVLQSGEDPLNSPEYIEDIVKKIKTNFSDCAITLSLGEYDRETYECWYSAGADRYLLRHETALSSHYHTLHPSTMRLETRLKALEDLKDIGYQVGAGFMVGSPYQTTESLSHDFYFLQQFRPHMIGIGPFIPQKDTPFKDKVAGELEDTLIYLALLRLTLPDVLLPATTALGTINPLGREMGIRAGANVLMPNLSPTDVREKYKLYDNKICTGEEAAECADCTSGRMKRIGYEIVTSRGDSPRILE